MATASDAPRLLSRMINFTSSVSGADKLFRTTVYTLRIVSVALTKRYGDSSVLAKRVVSLAGPLADTRMVLRLFGMLPTIDGILTNEETDSFLRPLSIVQAWSMVLYYPLDNIYWLALHEIIPMSAEARDACSRVSCQAWLVYIVLDIITYIYRILHLYHERKILENTIELNDGAPSTIDHQTDLQIDAGSPLLMSELKEDAVAMRQEEFELLLRVVATLSDLCLAVHWSVKKSSFPPMGVGVAGSISSLIGLYLKWKYTT